jgi:hypothetical protein
VFEVADHDELHAIISSLRALAGSGRAQCHDITSNALALASKSLRVAASTSAHVRAEKK